MYAEAVLFVDDNQGKAMNVDTLLEQGMCSNDKLARPSAIDARDSRRAAAFWLPLNHAGSMPSGPNQSEKLRQCCSARISVGAMMAACTPQEMALRQAIAATTVLPEPTSPWIRRIIGCGCDRS